MYEKWTPPMKRSKQQTNTIRKYKLTADGGHFIELEGHLYITHSGLLAVAAQEGCAGISVLPVLGLCDATKSRWVFKATVFRHGTALGFDGFGDADPTNVSSLVLGAEIRVAETRAVNRALRKAYGIGLCSAEELGARTTNLPPPAKAAHTRRDVQVLPVNGFQPLLRDQLHRIIRHHGLDASLVKRYASDFCGTASLREASRELVQDFIHTLAEAAENDKPALLSILTSYRDPTPGAA
jgi:hypothetical protein